jgi:hypothetical protein
MFSMKLNKEIIKKTLELPERIEIRSAFYILPLFFPWVIGLTFEKNSSALISARRGMVLFYAFIVVLIIIYAISNLLTGLFPNLKYTVGWFDFVTLGIVSLLFSGFSLYLAFREFTKSSASTPFLDKIADRIEFWLGR